MKTAYFKTSRTGLLVTTVYDHQTEQWGIQVTDPDREPGFHLEGNGLRLSNFRLPGYRGDVPVGVGTGGQRIHFESDALKAEYWPVSPKNGLWGGSLLVWGASHLGQLLKLMRGLLDEQLDEVSEVRADRPAGFLPTHFVREILPYQRKRTLVSRMEGILTDGLIPWNLRLALRRMRGEGMPVGDQISSEHITGGYRYNFFNMSFNGCFSASPVCIVPKRCVVLRSSCRYHHADSGANKVPGSVGGKATADVLFRPEAIPPTAYAGEFLVHGQIAPSEMIVITICQDVVEACRAHTVECRHGGVMGIEYNRLYEERMVVHAQDW